MASRRQQAGIAGFGRGSGGVDWTRSVLETDHDWQRPRTDFRDSELYSRWDRRVNKSDNDFIIVVAAASKSAVSGVGKTTLAVELARYFDASPTEFSAEDKATLDPEVFAQELLSDPEKVPDGSAILFDESQGTLGSDGVDSRRSMASSVMSVTTALSTMRFRQFTSIIVTQNTDWIDKRVDDILDILILIQPTDGRMVRAEVFDTYKNDLQNAHTRYTERVDTIEWPELPTSDGDYQVLHEMKEKSATDDLEDEVASQDGDTEDDTPDELPKEKQMEIAQDLRDKGFTIREIADRPYITYSRGPIGRETEAPEDS